MFASKTPRDMIEYFNAQAGAHLNLAGLDPNDDALWEQQVQEETDVWNSVQHNEPNPILLDFRDMHGDAQLWLETIDGPEGGAFLAETPKAFGYIDSDVIDHARRVLTRLANFPA